MTPAEYTQLNLPRLSHAARTLYTLHLRRQAQQHNGYVQVSYPELGRALAVENPAYASGFSFQVNASQLTRLFQELIEANLLQLEQAPQEEHYHGARFRLPLLLSLSTVLPLPQAAQPMTPQWRPEPDFATLCQLCGLMETAYGEDELGEFIAYWLGRPEVFATPHQWMLKFIKALKAKRYIRKSPTPSVGYQVVSSVPESQVPSQRALEMIAEAKRIRDQQGEENETI
ncbi:MAG: DnaT-like ssDNA-binding domain-containing protein [Aeromonadaceae bacterium]